MHRSILIDASHWEVPEPTGVERYVDSLLPRLFAPLLEANFDRIHLVGYSEKPSKPLPDAVEWHASPPRKLWGQRTLLDWQRRLNPSLFFTPSGIPPLRSKVPTVFTVHDLSFYRSPDSYNIQQLFRLQGMAKYAAKRAAALCVPSQFVKEDLIAKWHIPETCIHITPLALPEGKHIKASAPSWLPASPFLLYVGRIEHKKNLATIITAFEHLEAQPDLLLVLAGKDGVGAQQIHRIIAALPPKTRARILVPGYISEEEKQWLYEHAELSLVPSPYEGFGLPVLEAFAAQVPVLCAAGGGVAEVAAAAALQVESFNAESWQKAMYTGLSDRKLRKELRYAGMQRLADFTWPATAQATVQAFTAALPS